MELVPADFTTLDRAALAWFLLTWLGYGPLIRALPSPKSITSRMLRIRRAWMHAMLGRDNRITDASLIGHAVHSATFFASTTVVALAALLGVLGNLDRAHTAIGELAFAAKTSHPFLEGKLLLLILVFSHTFLKLSWALRQLNYCVAIIGAAPLKPNPAQRDRIADRTSVVLSLTVNTFNAGIRGYYFALAALAWLLGPAAFVLATSGMAAMLLWRQFGSATSEAIGWGLAALDGEDAVSGRYDTIDRPVYADGA